MIGAALVAAGLVVVGLALVWLYRQHTSALYTLQSPLMVRRSGDPFVVLGFLIVGGQLIAWGVGIDGGPSATVPVTALDFPSPIQAGPAQTVVGSTPLNREARRRRN